MDFYGLKEQVNKIEMSDETKERIIRKCRLELAAERSEKTVKKFMMRKSAMVLVAAVLCLCLAVGVGAAAGGGAFYDVKDWRGTVTGTEYVQASEEISIEAEAKEGVVTVNVDVLKADKAPYLALEQLGIGNGCILDSSGAVAAKDVSVAPAAYADGAAQLVIAFDGVQGEEYVLRIDSFIGFAKADQPLEISGSWEAEFIA